MASDISKFVKGRKFWQDLKVGTSRSKKNSFICFNESPWKMTKNVFLFHLRSFFRSQDFYIFVLTFWSCRKKRLIRKTRFQSFKVYDVTTWLTNFYNTHIAQYRRSKGYQTKKVGQEIEYNKRNIFLHKSCRKCGRDIFPDLLLFFKKLYIK